MGKLSRGVFNAFPVETTARRPPLSERGNAPFRFRAAALFSRGGSKLPLYFGKLNRVCHVGLRPWIILIGALPLGSLYPQDSFVPKFAFFPFPLAHLSRWLILQFIIVGNLFRIYLKFSWRWFFPAFWDCTKATFSPPSRKLDGNNNGYFGEHTRYKRSFGI